MSNAHANDVIVNRKAFEARNTEKKWEKNQEKQ